MRVSIRLKLFLSYAGIVFVSLLMLGWTTQILLGKNVRNFMGDFESHGPPPGGDNRLLETLESSLVYTTIAAGVLAILLSLLVSVVFTNPITELIEATKAIAKGNYKRRVKVQSQDELGELTKALNTMAASLEENHELQQELITNVAHELATPITNIRGYLEAINDGLIKGKKKSDTLKLMSEETDRLTLMLNEVRELAQIQHPNFEIKTRRVNLGKLVQKVITQMEPQVKNKNITIKYKNASKETLVNIDRDRIVQVLQNLLTNAIKYSPKNSLIKIDLKTKDKSLILKVTDEGPGIAQSDLPHLFERFYRADQSRSRKTGGLGIGLSIVKEVMEAHGGSVSVKSKIKQGTSFSCFFPL
ncbi:MAG: two-component system sensor histidine kinase BaeS [Oceanicoccus sp.]|jgi:two-component system sensor histidine kinase BaeS